MSGSIKLSAPVMDFFVYYNVDKGDKHVKRK